MIPQRTHEDVHSTTPLLRQTNNSNSSENLAGRHYYQLEVLHQDGDVHMKTKDTEWKGSLHGGVSLQILNKPVQHVLLSFFGIRHSLLIALVVPHGPSMRDTQE